MIELEHSPLGGSSAARFIACAGSFLMHREQLASGEFEETTSEFAELGTGSHELAAAAIAGQTEPFEFLSEEFNGYRAGWDGEINLDAVAVYFNECMAIMARYAGVPGTMVMVESTITVPELHPLLKGTVDFGFYVPRVKLYLRDYKNGEGVGVAAPNNKQLLYYAFLMLMSDAELRTLPDDFPVSLGIVQPNFYGLYEDADVWETTAGVVRAFGHDVLLPRMDHLSVTPAYTPDDFVTGEHCQFCPVLIDCPKMQRAFRLYADASEDFVAMLTNEELSDLYAERENARRFMKALETVVYARKVTGGEIPSAKLVEKQTARVWKPGGEAAVRAAFGAKAIAPVKVLSPAAVEKLSSTGKALALEWGYKPDAGGLVVAPLSDRRPEAKPRTNASVFEAHAQSPIEMGF